MTKYERHQGPMGIDLNRLATSDLWVVVAQGPDGQHVTIGGGKQLRTDAGQLLRAAMEGLVRALNEGDVHTLEAVCDIVQDDDYQADHSDPTTPEA